MSSDDLPEEAILQQVSYKRPYGTTHPHLILTTDKGEGAVFSQREKKEEEWLRWAEDILNQHLQRSLREIGTVEIDSSVNPPPE